MRTRHAWLVILALSTCARAALAAWPNQPAINLPVCTATTAQNAPTSVSDGSGGAILTWQDQRGGGDLYAQHVLATGSVDPAWPANGRAICTAVGFQYGPTIVGDGAGGAIIAWYDYRGGVTSDIYAQHVLASGVVDPAWPVDGRAVCVASSSQGVPTLVSDGAGGAIITWFDARNVINYDIYAQHVKSSGVVDPAWPTDGRALCLATGDQLYPTITGDGAGGAIVTWQDGRNAAGSDIYAQHVLASGVVDPVWPVDGRALCAATNNQTAPLIVGDGAGGAIVTWTDLRSGANYDLYAEHVLATGVVDPAWPADGRSVCSAVNAQLTPAVTSDGAGGLLVAWDDLRSASTDDIYAQHLLSNGIADPAWPSDGRSICTAARNQIVPAITGDGSGGAVICWQDNRAGANYDLYAQHVLATGTVDPLWPVDGRLVSSADNDQLTPSLVGDGAGGVIAGWTDLRADGGDIYAQRLARFGYLGTPEAEIVGVKDIPNDNGGEIKLSWNASYLDTQSDPNLSAYDVLRSLPPNVAQARIARGERLSTTLAGLSAAGGLLTLPDAAQGYYWELLGSVQALHYLSGYSFVAQTAGDSMGAGNPRTAFMVVARNAGDTMFWPSRPDSGYSVDNVPPVVPAPFTANYAAGTTHLHWDPNHESDLAGYRLYRGSSASFTPSPSSLLAALPDTGYADPASATFTYKLTAVDAHGNESAVATITPAGIAGVGGFTGPLGVSLAPPSPNPTAGATTLRFSLPVGERVTLDVHDAAGRLVRALVGGMQPAGEHAAIWDLRDQHGRTVAAGLYLVRLEAGGRTLVRRIAVAG